jgi:hypothetical protein
VIKLWRIDASGALCALVALTTVHAQATSGARAVVASEFINEHAPYRSSHASTIADGVGLAMNDGALSEWPRLLTNWLRVNGFLKE